MDEDVGPGGGDELILADDLAAALHHQVQQLEGAGTQLNAAISLHEQLPAWK